MKPFDWVFAGEEPDGKSIWIPVYSQQEANEVRERLKRENMAKKDLTQEEQDFHPTRATGWHRSRDVYLRSRGFEIFSRPKTGENIWVRRIAKAPFTWVKYTETQALVIADQEIANDVEPLKR